jgi:hypothetical protein
MSLEKFQINKFFINELYNKNVIYLEQNKTAKNESYSICFSGGNLKNFAIIYQSSNKESLSAEAFEMLTKLISACKLTMQDIALIDLKENEFLTHELLKSELQAKLVLLFGVDTMTIDLPFMIPKYKSQEFNDTVFILADNINKMPHDKESKILLWNCLKENL